MNTIEDLQKPVLDLVSGIMDSLANTEQGQKTIDNFAEIIGRLYSRLVIKHGLSPEHAATIISRLEIFRQKS